MSKNYKLQNILFCDNDRLEAYWEMFFKSSRPQSKNLSRRSTGDLS